MELPIRPRLFSPCISLPTFLSSLLPNCGFDLSDTAVAITLLLLLQFKIKWLLQLQSGRRTEEVALGRGFQDGPPLSPIQRKSGSRCGMARREGGGGGDGDCGGGHGHCHCADRLSDRATGDRRN